MQKVLITGANRGIGLALTKLYIAAGAEVIACCRTPDSADALKATAAEASGRLRIMTLDVGDVESIANLKKQLGAQPIDILLNNAGVRGNPETQSATYIDPQDWQNTMRVNGLGPILLAQALRENLLRGSEKKVVAITSSAGSTERDFNAGLAISSKRYAYRASKAALNNGMRGLSRDWAEDGVVVGIVEPGWVRTDMGGSGATVSPEESARGIIECITKLGPKTTGVFQRYWGEVLPW